MHQPNSGKIKQFNAILTKLGLQDEKRRIIRTISSGRTESTKELTDAELQSWLDQYKAQAKPQAKPVNEKQQRMINKIIAQAREMGMVSRYKAVDASGNVDDKSDYRKLNAWMLERSYLKKAMKDYTVAELPELVSQFEKFYLWWLQNSRK